MCHNTCLAKLFTIALVAALRKAIENHENCNDVQLLPFKAFEKDVFLPIHGMTSTPVGHITL